MIGIDPRIFRDPFQEPFPGTLSIGRCTAYSVLCARFMLPGQEVIWSVNSNIPYSIYDQATFIYRTDSTE
jgi:hypothetical protein